MTIIKKFEPEIPKKTYSKKYIGIVGFCLFLLMIVEIWASNNIVTYGEKLENLSLLAKTLSLNNQLLENEIASLASLNNVASQSAELGFSQPESIEYIR